MKYNDRYNFEFSEEFAVVTVTQRNKSKIVLRMEHEHAKIIQRDLYNLTFANYDGFRARVYIHGKDKERTTLARWMIGLNDKNKSITFKNLDSFDFREGNLVEVSCGEPSQNRSGAQINGKSGVRGVTWYKKYGKWNGQVIHNGRNYNVGYNEDKNVIEQAVIAKRKELLEHSYKDK